MSTLVVSLSDPLGHALAIAHAMRDEPNCDLERGAGVPRLDGESDLLAILAIVAPDLTVDDAGFAPWSWLADVRALVKRAESFADEVDQASYEQAYAAWKLELEKIEAHLRTHRYLFGDQLTFADLLLYTFALRLDPVYARLFKANAYLLEDLPALHAFVRDLHERPAFHATLDWDAIVGEPTRSREVLAPRGIVSLGRPDLHAPHFRHELSTRSSLDASVEEDPDARRTRGEFVRGQSKHRRWIGSDELPGEPGRYHLFAPYNCPWSHRALLARAVKGLEDVVGASIVCFRRHPERGWQFNPAIEGCTIDHVKGRRFVVEYYEDEGSTEKSVPILYDTVSETIVNNESAEILRMFDDAFGRHAKPIRLYPKEHRAEIDRVNEQVYQRINNGAYKAGFAKSQLAYEQAYHRYFAALRWVDGLLADDDWLVGSDEPTEADLRLFPTVFRHDAVYWARFRLDAARIRDFPNLAGWLERMLDWPGVREASNLDHARNGYFGRSGNEIVPAAPEPLELSPKDYPRDVWLGDISPARRR